MIKEIEPDQLDGIDSIIERFRKQSGEGSVPENFIDQIRESVAKDRSSLYGSYTEDGLLNGIGLFGKVSSRISFVFANGNLELEKRILSALFERFKSDCHFIVTGGSWISEELSGHIVDIGFIKHERVYMTLPRANLETKSEQVLKDGMQFRPYSSSDLDVIAELIFKATDGHVDQDVFPEFFGTVEYCTRFVKNIESNRYGNYTEGSSWILLNNDKPIGVCFITCRNGDTGYIPDIALEHEFRGQGLGKAMLVHSMKRQIESDDSITKIDLDVTLANDARYLYQSLGFNNVREYTLYTWRK